jgi:hypothetical protein
MRRLSFKLYAFRLLAAGVAFALGVASTRQWLRRLTFQPPPSAVVGSAQSTQLEQIKCASSDNDIRDESRVEDRYYNYNFGFSVDLPRGMVGRTSPPPMPQHGFVIDLENPQARKSDSNSRSEIVVDASYNSLEWRSFDEAIRDDLSWVSEGGNHIKSLSRTPVRLGGLHAMRFVQVYENNLEEMINDVTLAFRKENEEEVVYTISLNTPLSRYEQDKAAVAYLQKTWCLQPLP